MEYIDSYYLVGEYYSIRIVEMFLYEAYIEKWFIKFGCMGVL